MSNLVEVQSRLLDTLRSITRAVEASALERCPYHATEDRCTLSRGCLNQRRVDAQIFCNGARLNANSP